MAQFTVPFVTKNTFIGSPLTDTTFLMDETVMVDATWWATINNGGGGIRVFSDAAKLNRLAIEVRTCITGTEILQLYIKLPLLSITGGDVIYVEANDVGSQPAAGAAFGREATWPNTILGLHIEDRNDFSANSRGVWFDDPTGFLPVKIERGADFTDSAASHIWYDWGVNATYGEISVEFWLNINSAPDADAALFAEDDIASDHMFLYASSVGFIGFRASGNLPAGALFNGPSHNTLNHFLFTYDVPNKFVRGFMNGNEISAAISMTTMVNLQIGRYPEVGDRFSGGAWGNSNLDGQMDEFRCFTEVKSADYGRANYINQNTNTSFWEVFVPPATGRDHAVGAGVGRGVNRGT